MYNKEKLLNLYVNREGELYNNFRLRIAAPRENNAHYNHFFFVHTIEITFFLSIWPLLIYFQIFEVIVINIYS